MIKQFFLEEIEDILRKADPEKLIAIGAPDDEYHFEAKTLLSVLNHNDTLDDVHHKLYDCFYNAFCTYVYEDGTIEHAKDHEAMIKMFNDYKSLATELYTHIISKL
jgi:hypothetical protein